MMVASGVTVVAASRCVVSVVPRSDEVWEVVWYDDPSLTTGPYQQGLTYSTKEEALLVAARIINGVRFFGLNPQHVDEVLSTARGQASYQLRPGMVAVSNDSGEFYLRDIVEVDEGIPGGVRLK